MFGYVDFCVFLKSTNFKICGVITDLAQGHIQRLIGHSGFYWQSDKT